MRVHHILCGTMCPIGGRLVSGSGSLLATSRLICHCLLVETSDGLVLVDSGFGAEDIEGGRLPGHFRLLVRPRLTLDDTAAKHVERLGFTRRDVRHVVLTHLDVDHAGGLSDFPDATVHVLAAEHDAYVFRRTLIERRRYIPAQTAHGVRWKLHAPDGERWNGFERVSALDQGDDVLLVPLVGHTRGHAGVAVRSDVGWLLHAGDAYFHEDEMGTPPHCPPALAFFQRTVAVDDASRRENRRRLRELHQSRGDDPGALVRVFPAHGLRDFEALSGTRVG